MSKGIDLIAAERERQVIEEGYTPEHDAGHAHALVDAARAYAHAGAVRAGSTPLGWPWAPEDWKPSGDSVRNLAKAGALIAAAIDSLEAGRETLRALISDPDVEGSDRG